MLGTLTAPASTARIGVPVAGAIVDPAFHVNMAWPAQSVPASGQASVITPAPPRRVLGLSVLASAPAPAPERIPEWKGKAGFQRVKLLESGEAAVPAIGGRCLGLAGAGDRQPPSLGLPPAGVGFR